MAEETVRVGDKDGKEGGEGPDHEGGQEVRQQGRYGTVRYCTWSSGLKGGQSRRQGREGGR